MSSILNGTKNSRTLFKDNLRYIRSDAPVHIDSYDIEFLKRNNILTAIDLRSHRERSEHPVPLEFDPDFRYLAMPVTGGSTLPASPDDVVHSYLAMVDLMMTNIIETILNAQTNVLFFCTAGKDRTGVVSAILLDRLGIDDTYIIQDYMESSENLKDTFVYFAANHPEIDPRIIQPSSKTMAKFLQLYRDRQISNYTIPETRDLILRHPVFDDWEGMYRNLWSREESARYMLWDVTKSEKDAKARMERSIAFQTDKPVWFVYEKESGEPIGFAGITQVDDGIFEEAGIALGPDFTGRGYGKQILNALADYTRDSLCGRILRASCRNENVPSRGMIMGCGFRYISSENRIDPRNKTYYILEHYEKEL